MSANFPLRMPASVKAIAAELARREGVSLNQFIASAVAEKVSALTTADYFAARAARADRARFDAVMARAGTQPPRAGDELE
jgi:hypothetical protein